jgi:Pyridoxamine 5'-phosphate oxidase
MWAGERVVDVFGLARGRRTTMASAPRLTTDRIWRVLEKTAFAVISFVTPEGKPRSSGVVCAAARRHLYVVIASDSWKARQISDGDPVSVTVPVRRGGLLSLIAPIPPATVTFRARATVQPAGSVSIESVSKKLASLLPPERKNGVCWSWRRRALSSPTAWACPCETWRSRLRRSRPCRSREWTMLSRRIGGQE